MTRVVETSSTKKCSIPLIEVISIYTYSWYVCLIRGEARVTRFDMGIKFEVRFECHSYYSGINFKG